MRKYWLNLIYGFEDQDNESLFIKDYYEKLKIQIRIGFLISIFIYLVFFFIDHWVFPELEPVLLINRITVVSLFVFILLLSYSRFFANYLQLILFIYGMIATFGIIWKLRLLNISGYDFSFFYPGLILTTSLITFYLRIRFIAAAWLHIISIASYVGLYLFFLEDSPIHSSVTLSQTFVNSLFFIICSSFLSLYGAYYLEILTRQDFENSRKLDYLNHSLEHRVKERTSELENEKKKSIRSLLEGQEKERERIARELHDNIHIQLAQLKQELEMQTEKGDFSNVKQTIEKILKINKEVRDLSHNQSSWILKRYGLVKAIEEQAVLIANEFNMKVNMDFFGMEKELPYEIQLNLYRSFQEAVHNTVKYACATKVDLQLIQKNKSIIFTISDNGKGFDISSYEGNGHGLQNIRLRIEKQLGGNVQIDSSPKAGTTIIMNVNLRHYD
jgi:signal transduction histidine kinase